MGLDTAVSEEQPQEAIELAQQVANQHLAAADSMAAGQVRLGRLLQSRRSWGRMFMGQKVFLNEISLFKKKSTSARIIPIRPLSGDSANLVKIKTAVNMTTVW